MDDLVEIVARVIDFVPNAMSDYYESGGFALYDATVLQILAPARLKGCELQIFHDDEIPETSPWLDVGRCLRFSIAEKYLSNEYTLFDGAIQDLRVDDDTLC